MGKRGELFTRKIFTADGEKTFFFNVKENRFGDHFLNIVESRKGSRGRFERSSILIFKEDLESFSNFIQLAVDGIKNKQTNLEEELRARSGKRKYSLEVFSNKQRVITAKLKEERLDSASSFSGEMIFLIQGQEDDFMKGYLDVISFFKKI